MTDGLATSYENLYKANVLVCAKQGVNLKECEKRIDSVIRAIQGKAKEVCKGDEACQDKVMEYQIDVEEIEKLRQRFLKTYT